MPSLPPRSGDAPALSCSRLLRWPDEASRCPHDATHHVIWNEENGEANNGLVCDEHLVETQDRWKPLAIHPYTLTCSMPGALFVHSLNRCVMPDELDTIAAVTTSDLTDAQRGELICDSEMSSETMLALTAAGVFDFAEAQRLVLAAHGWRMGKVADV